MGKIRKEVKKTKHKTNAGAQTVKPGVAQGLVFNTGGYGQHILKNPQVVQVINLQYLCQLQNSNTVPIEHGGKGWHSANRYNP